MSMYLSTSDANSDETKTKFIINKLSFYICIGYANRQLFNIFSNAAWYNMLLEIYIFVMCVMNTYLIIVEYILTQQCHLSKFKKWNIMMCINIFSPQFNQGDSFIFCAYIIFVHINSLSTANQCLTYIHTQLLKNKQTPLLWYFFLACWYRFRYIFDNLNLRRIQWCTR